MPTVGNESIRFEVSMMKNVEVIGQLNREVIVCLAHFDQTKVYLTLFDQHAVDERIRLETIFLGIITQDIGIPYF